MERERERAGTDILLSFFPYRDLFAGTAGLGLFSFCFCALEWPYSQLEGKKERERERERVKISKVEGRIITNSCINHCRSKSNLANSNHQVVISI